MDTTPQTPADAQQPGPSGRGIGAALLLAIVVTPIVVLIVSNPDIATVAWANWDWEAPMWLVLSATFLAGIIGGKLFGWLWRTWRRRKRRLVNERDATRRLVSGQGG
jgi:uncharacterized integral membrane protein